MRYFVLYDGIVITGKVAGPRYLLMDRDNVEIKNAAHLYGKAVLEAHDALSDKHGDKNISILHCGKLRELGLEWVIWLFFESIISSCIRKQSFHEKVGFG